MAENIFQAEKKTGRQKRKKSSRRTPENKIRIYEILSVLIEKYFFRLKNVYFSLVCFTQFYQIFGIDKSKFEKVGVLVLVPDQFF